MGWKRIEDKIQTPGDWSNFVRKIPNTTPEDAMRFVFAHPKEEITFFFYVRNTFTFETPLANEHGPFETGMAVFFKGQAAITSSLQCDIYEKKPIATIYINPLSNQQFLDIKNYVLAKTTPSPAIDAVCIFAGNFVTYTRPMLRAKGNPHATAQFNPNIQMVLDSGYIKQLQNQGITVLLTILDGCQTGWSQFADQSTAQSFVDYLKTEVVTLYGLDGIDIDDEYSIGTIHNDSLAMVTTLMKQAMPNKLITKALYDDHVYFNTDWNGHHLGLNLDYGWEMTYYDGDINFRLHFYTGKRMSKSQLCIGFSAEDRFSWEWQYTSSQASEVIREKYGGGMMFNFEHQPRSIKLMKTVVNAMCGPGSWKTIGSIRRRCSIQ
ncbi:uncharacterized protein LOC114543297 [Dendronephthya gigantea]|uniref:uncharacterized protein LOC114543297 n=1 Tax=Dendronephthya gigantea TaxID=151771 RepID=UPI00106CBFD8|nr:uncharacterized protein LOC114543297 [Dendronephthya gigantea]